MSKAIPKAIMHDGLDHFCVAVEPRQLTLPEYIEGKAKGWIKQNKSGVWLAQIKQHKPHHTKGRKPRFYLVLAPQRRPLITTDYKAGWLEYSKR